MSKLQPPPFWGWKPGRIKQIIHTTLFASTGNLVPAIVLDRITIELVGLIFRVMDMIFLNSSTQDDLHIIMGRSFSSNRTSSVERTAMYLILALILFYGLFYWDNGIVSGRTQTA